MSSCNRFDGPACGLVHLSVGPRASRRVADPYPGAVTTPRPAGDRVFLDVATAVLGPGDHRIADLLDVLAQMPAGQVDVVHANDDLLPRLAHENGLDAALSAARLALRPGGLFIAAVPELDKLRRLRPTAPPPRVSGRGEQRQVTVQLWDWAEDGQSYGLEVLQLARSDRQWELVRAVSTRHQVITGAQVTAGLTAAGFAAVQRLTPKESGHPLPLWVAVAP